VKMEQTQCSEMLAIKHHMPENNPKDYTRHVGYKLPVVTAQHPTR
jgi:hypothetical protein